VSLLNVWAERLEAIVAVDTTTGSSVSTARAIAGTK